jgi:hypothetical protein
MLSSVWFLCTSSIVCQVSVGTLLNLCLECLECDNTVTGRVAYSERRKRLQHMQHRLQISIFPHMFSALKQGGIDLHTYAIDAL